MRKEERKKERGYLEARRFLDLDDCVLSDRGGLDVGHDDELYELVSFFVVDERGALNRFLRVKLEG